MGTTAATFLAVIDLMRGARCRGMLFAGPQADTGGMHGVGIGSGSGDHAPAVGATERRGDVGNVGGAGTPRTDGGSSRAAELRDGRSRPQPD